jgi:hypothetical protein
MLAIFKAFGSWGCVRFEAVMVTEYNQPCQYKNSLTLTWLIPEKTSLQLCCACFSSSNHRTLLSGTVVIFLFDVCCFAGKLHGVWNRLLSWCLKERRQCCRLCVLTQPGLDTVVQQSLFPRPWPGAGRWVEDLPHIFTQVLLWCMSPACPRV